MKARNNNFTAMIGACMIITAAAFGQNAAQPKPDTYNPLAGPRATSNVNTLSIVTTTFNGEVEVPRPTPEEATLALLTLNENEVKLTRAVLTKRAAILDTIIRNNIPLLTSLGVVFAAGDTKDKVNTSLEALSVLQPLLADGPLESQLRVCLSAENKAKFNKILRDYWNAFAAWKSTTLKDDGKPFSRADSVIAGRFASLQHELTATFEAYLYSGRLTFELLFTGVELTPQQREKISTLITDNTDPKTGEIAKDDAPKLLFTVLPLLDRPGQREIFFKNLGRVSRGEIAAPPKEQDAINETE